MAQNILDIIEQTLLNLALKYQTFSANADLQYEDIKDYDTELNDIMERYKTLKSLQSVISVEDLQILYNEYNTIFQDFKTKYESGYFKGQEGLSNYELAVKNGFQGTELEYLDSLKGSNGSFEDLTQEQKALLKGEKGDKGEDGSNGTFEDLTQEQKNILFNEFKISINLSDILSRLEALENVSTPIIIEKTITYRQSEEGYHILTNFVPSEGETGFFVINLSAVGSETGELRFAFTFDSSLPFYQSFNIVSDGYLEADTFTFNFNLLSSKDNNLILFVQLFSLEGLPINTDITLSSKIETVQNHSSLDFIDVSDSSSYVDENWLLI